jgi:large subunit ribosomal protein L15
MGPHRTQTQAVNVAALEERFDAGAEITPELLAERGLIRNTRIDVKLLGQGDLTKKLSITVHAASASAREKVEAAGGTLTLLREPKERKPKRSERRPRREDAEPEEVVAETSPDEEPDTGPEPDTEPEEDA